MSSTTVAATPELMMAEMAALKAEVAALKAAAEPKPKLKAPTAREAQAAALKARPAVDQPAANFGDARQNAQHYMSHAKLYKLSEAEEAALKAAQEKAEAEMVATFDVQKEAYGTPNEKATYNAYKIAQKIYENYNSVRLAINKEHERYKMYYFGTMASQKDGEKIRSFLIWRYYVFEFEDDVVHKPCNPIPIGLLNPHAYFAARRQGRHDFLNFVDKTQPAPKLPKSEEEWPLAHDYQWDVVEHIDDDNWDNWDEKEAAADECAGCHYCQPAQNPQKPADIPAPSEDRLITLNYTTRAHSSGSETKWTRIFRSYEAASKAILKEFKVGGLALEYWEEDDCYEDGYEFLHGDAEPLPEPTVAWACKKFNPVALAAIASGYDNKVYGPYSEFCCHCPFEIHISLCKVE